MHMNNTHHSTSKCWVCDQVLDTRVKRNFLLRTLLFWLPVKVYFCTKCASKRYVIERKSTYNDVKTA
jgi:uncharacterized protein YlaI